MDDHHQHSPPPTASPRKRPRPSHADSPSPRGAALWPAPNKAWLSQAKNFRETARNLYDNFTKISNRGVPPDKLLYRYSDLRLTFTDFINKLDEVCGKIVGDHPQLASCGAFFSQEVQTEDAPDLDEAEGPLSPLLTETEPTEAEMPPPKTYAQAATLHTPQQPQRPRRQRKPSTDKESNVSTLSNPTRVIVNLHDQPGLGARKLSPTELHRRLTEAVSRVPNTPCLLGIKWNRKGNLILSYPHSSPHKPIRSHFPAICSVLDCQSKAEFRFDIPWRRVHLANIWAREETTDPIASEEDLRKTLLLNPAIQALNLTIQASWLRKPNLITGTHTSAVIAFEDPDGSTERNLLRSTIFAFGEVITLKKWHDKPPSKTNP